MSWIINTLEIFDKWFEGLTLAEQEDILVGIYLLEGQGPNLSRPYSDTLEGSRFKNMKELRVQHKGKPYRVLYAFDPKRRGILILGGNKEGDKRWYKKHIPIADKLYQQYLEQLKEAEV
ncbi:MAG: type II toxin-antitoxin system RelE/ParE family toxin [Pseudomonadales bacterium]